MNQFEKQTNYIGIIDNEYYITQILAQKSDSLVLRGTHGGTGEEKAIKVYINSANKVFFHEDAMNKSLINHQCLIKAEKCVPQSEVKDKLIILNKEFSCYSYLTLPYQQNGSLMDLIVKAHQMKHKFSQDTVRYLFRQLVRAVFQLHKVNRMAHCDIKPDNFIFKNEDNFELAMIDFGQSISSEIEASVPLGTDQYIPPEVRLATNYSPYDPKKSDIFGLGVSLFLLSFGQCPFQRATNEDKYYQHIQSGNFNQFLSSHPAFAKEHFLAQNQISDCVLVIQSCLNHIASYRPVISELLLHQYVSLAPNEITVEIKTELLTVLSA